LAVWLSGGWFLAGLAFKRLGFEVVWACLRRAQDQEHHSRSCVALEWCRRRHRHLRMRSYGNQRTRSDRRNPDRSTPGRAWSVGACPTCRLHRPCCADPGHRLVCVLSDLSIGASRSRAAVTVRWPQARAGKGGIAWFAVRQIQITIAMANGCEIRSSLQVLGGPRVTLRGAIYWGF
jgi:hypothetical protein